MGTEYYIIDTATKTFYDIGKGGWYEFNYDKEAFQDQDYLELFILEDVFDCSCYDEKEWQDIVKYVHNRIAPDLFKAFGKTKPENLIIVNDCGDDMVIMRAKGYKCIGTRYGEIGSEEYNKSMVFNNRHLDKNGIYYQRWYSLDKYLNYPEWKIY